MFRENDWHHIRVDIDVKVDPDVVDDIIHLKKFSDGSADGIYSSHNLEHLHRDDAVIAIATFRKVLKPGGLCVVGVPDFQMACEWIGKGDGFKTIYESPAGPITPYDMVFGYHRLTRNNPHQQHRNGFTVEYLSRIFAYAGFTSATVMRGEGCDIWAFASK
jgi:SAM-dependent methyltransferase